jgi:hypothetical protein
MADRRKGLGWERRGMDDSQLDGAAFRYSPEVLRRREERRRSNAATDKDSKHEARGKGGRGRNR